jgi:hypothetical protein
VDVMASFVSSVLRETGSGVAAADQPGFVAVMTTFPRARPATRWRMASGAWSSGKVR